MSDDVDHETGQPGYAEAMAELDAILDELEDGEVDIDHLADRVKRAATLVELCRGRVEDARLEVTRIVAELDGDSLTSPTVPIGLAPDGRSDAEASPVRPGADGGE
jgi:exodeoxyribonuclease VII small subunit